jgi:hypothetical protein
MRCGAALVLGHNRHRKKKFASAEDLQETDGNVALVLNACRIEEHEHDCKGQKGKHAQTECSKRSFRKLPRPLVGALL